MAAYKGKRSVQVLRRIVLSQTHQFIGSLSGAYGVVDVVEEYVPERIVHGTVELIAHEVPAPLAVADLVAGVFPDLAYKKVFRVCSFDPCASLSDERVRQLIGHVEPPSGSSHPEPVSDYSVLTQHKFSVALVFFDHFRQVLDSPPRPVTVFFVLVKLIPAAVWRVLVSVRAFAFSTRVIAVSVKVDTVRSGVAEHSVKDDAYAPPARCLCKVRKVLVCAERGVDVHVVARIVAVVGSRLEYRVQIYARDAE